MRTALVRAPLETLVAGCIAAAVGFGLVAVLGASNVLPREIAVVLTSAEASNGPGDIIVDGAPTDAVRGGQLVLLSLLVGGVPAAILATVLAARRSNEKRWAAWWANVFLAGLVFQLCSLIFTAFLLFLLLYAAIDSAAGAHELFPHVAALLLSVVCSIWGLHSWRALQFEAHEPSTRLISTNGVR